MVVLTKRAVTEQQIETTHAATTDIGMRTSDSSDYISTPRTYVLQNSLTRKRVPIAPFQTSQVFGKYAFDTDQDIE